MAHSNPYDRQVAADIIMRLGEDDLLLLNRLIIDRINLLQQARSTVSMARFATGDRVAFQGPGGQRLSGFILKLNKKTVTIVVDGGEQWNVAPAFLLPLSGGLDEVMGGRRP